MYASTIIGFKKVTKGDYFKLRVESEVILDDGFIFHPNFELSATESKKFLKNTKSKDIKSELQVLHDNWLSENIDHFTKQFRPEQSNRIVEDL